MKRKFKIYEGSCGEHILSVNEDGTCWADAHGEYCAISEVIEVDAVMLPAEDVTEKRIDILEKSRKEAHANWLSIAAAFDDKIAKLRAVPHLSNTDDS